MAGGKAGKGGLLLFLLVALLCLAACASAPDGASSSQESADTEPHRYLASIIDEPDTEDFQCTTINYTIALNTFDRLVETTSKPNGGVEIAPSLAQSWDISEDGLEYTFHLREGVAFSDGSPLTSSDVLYTFTRLLTHPASCNQDIVQDIAGAAKLAAGKADTLEGFQVVDDRTFVITLERPFAAFLSCLCMPGASILDEESTEKAGERFGVDPASTIGTGPFVFKEWDKGESILLEANPGYWNGEPALAGVRLYFDSDPNEVRKMVDDGELDIVNLDSLGDMAEFYLHGDVYRDRIHTSPHVAIDYIALNESSGPLADARVRKALQLALDRQVLLDAVYGGSGAVESGIFPHGLVGFNPDLPAIPYDPDTAKSLLKEAGYADGFDLTASLNSTSSRTQRQVLTLATEMWEKVGVRATVEVLDEPDFMRLRKAGELACYTANWAADFDDPDNFIYTFFGNRENTKFRSLCYPDDKVMSRVRAARAIMDEAAREKEYQSLEAKIVQEDAAWIPLFSKERHFFVSDRVGDFTVSWNGWFEPCYKFMSLRNA